MKSKTLVVLMTAFSIGVSPVGIISASAQDAPILPKKGAAQSGQSSSGATQQPDASGASSSGGADALTGKGTQQPSGSDASSSGATSGTTTDGSSGKAATEPGTKSQSGSSDSPKTPKSGQSSTEGQKPAGGQDTGTSTGSSNSSGETQKSGNAAKSSSGSTETPSNSKANVDNNTTVDSNTKNAAKTGANTTNVNISVEQQTEIRTVVKDVHVEPVRETDFTVSVGTTIPKKIRLEPLPPRIIEIVPQYKAYRFFLLADGRVVIVDPSAFTIVYIISA